MHHPRGHEWIASADDWVLDLAESILEALAARAVDMTASENNVVAALRIGIDAESKTDKVGVRERILIKELRGNAALDAESLHEIVGVEAFGFGAVAAEGLPTVRNVDQHNIVRMRSLQRFDAPIDEARGVERPLNQIACGRFGAGNPSG